MKWYLYSLRKYAVFEGRASRREHWTFELMNFAITLALFVAATRVGNQYFAEPAIYIYCRDDSSIPCELSPAAP